MNSEQNDKNDDYLALNENKNVSNGLQTSNSCTYDVCFFCNSIVRKNTDFFFIDYHNICLKDLTNKNFHNKNKNIETHISKLLKILSDTSEDLIIPCKCGYKAHIICLLQYCIFNITIKCEECQQEFNFSMKKFDENKKFLNIKLFITLIILSIIFLSFGILIITLKLIKTKIYYFWNFIIGVISLLISILFIYLNYATTKKYRKKLNNEYPLFEKIDLDNSDSNLSKTTNKEQILQDENYSKFQNYLTNNFCCKMSDIILLKLFNKLWTTNIVSTYNDLNEFIKNNNNEIYDDQVIKQQINEYSKENMFHGHQVIQSSIEPDLFDDEDDQVNKDLINIMNYKKRKSVLDIKSKTNSNINIKAKIIAYKRNSVNLGNSLFDTKIGKQYFQNSLFPKFIKIHLDKIKSKQGKDNLSYSCKNLDKKQDDKKKIKLPRKLTESSKAVQDGGTIKNKLVEIDKQIAEKKVISIFVEQSQDNNSNDKQ